jgi:hypothetical protein
MDILGGAKVVRSAAIKSAAIKNAAIKSGAIKSVAIKKYPPTHAAIAFNLLN